MSSIVRPLSSMVNEVCSIMEINNERRYKLQRGLQSIKREMEQVVGLMEDKNKECRGALQETRIQQLQEFVYNFEDFVETLRDPPPYSKPVLVAVNMDPRTEQLRSIEHFKETISSLGLYFLNQSGESSQSQDPDQGAMSDPDEDADEEQLQSIGGPKSEIVELLKTSPGEEQKLRVISIVGCRGVGKTALARAVRKKYSSSDEFDCVAWVVASGCNKKKALLDKILESVREDLARRAPDAENAPKEESEGASTTKPNLQDILSHKRCLVFVDDVQQALVWKDTVDACRKNGSRSRIVVTTSVRSVATACSSGSYVYRMQILSDADSESLFWRKVYGSETAYPPDALVTGSKSIFSKCGGLPRALTSVAKHLNMKGDTLESTHCIDVGQNLGKDYLLGTNNAENVFKEMRRALMHSYGSLPDYDHRSCMLYLGIFPKGHKIKSKSLVRRLVAEGLVVDEGCKCFEELIDRCIVEPVQICNNSVVAKRCQVHGVVLEYIVHKSVAKNVVTLIQGHDPVLKAASTQARVRRLSVQSSTKERFDELEDKAALRSLTMFETEPTDLKMCKMLRILDLEGCHGLDQEGFLEGLSELLLLKYLNLRSTRINKLPTKIKKLQRLETLDIRDTDVKILPLDVIMLPKLAYLFGKFQLPEVPTEGKDAHNLYEFLNKKSSLHTLAGFVTNKKDSPEHVVLIARNLKKIKVWCNDTPADDAGLFPDYTKVASSSAAASDRPSKRRRNWFGKTHVVPDDYACPRSRAQECQSRILDFIKLLKIRATPLDSVSIVSNGVCSDLLSSLEGGERTISSIKLRGILDCLPESNKLRELGRIKKLQLFSTGLTAKDLSALQVLLGLEYLKLVEHADRFCDSIFVVEKNGFQSLKSLCIDAPKVPEMQFKEGSMRSLTSLYLLCSNSQNPSGVIDGISHLAKLSEVILHSSMQRAWEAVANGHPNRPCVKRQPEPTANTQ
ncbi:disease resistance protein RGA4-like [Lolium rigidum]|uniref:disease resistance protein RGA4-like n=1 Tax=Lolium rigidum TaxID=89674 RepID=UPI001F5DB2F5|nr:disease resistance protein RGA4-like [Lolium rigidum]